MEVRDQELAALLTLLRRRAGGAGWNVLAGEVAEAGSAMAVLSAPADGELFASPDLASELKQAASDVREDQCDQYFLQHSSCFKRFGGEDKLFGLRVQNQCERESESEKEFR